MYNNYQGIGIDIFEFHELFSAQTKFLVHNHHAYIILRAYICVFSKCFKFAVRQPSMNKKKVGNATSLLRKQH